MTWGGLGGGTTEACQYPCCVVVQVQHWNELVRQVKIRLEKHNAVVVCFAGSFVPDKAVSQLLTVVKSEQYHTVLKLAEVKLRVVISSLSPPPPAA
jgi:fructose-1-phosphate kinase PfkB-like protein